MAAFRGKLVFGTVYALLWAVPAALGAASGDCSSDPMAAFPTNLMGNQIFGLGSSSGGSQEDCARKCCNDPTCSVFSYCPSNSLACGKQSPDSTCMTGDSDARGNCSDGGGAIWW